MTASTRRALLGQTGLAAGVLAVPTAALAGGLPETTSPALLALEDELEDCLRQWLDLEDFARCYPWRIRILEKATELPVGNDQDAATMLRLALKVAVESGPEEWANRQEIIPMSMGSPEDGHVTNMVRAVQAYLDRTNAA